MKTMNPRVAALIPHRNQRALTQLELKTLRDRFPTRDLQVLEEERSSGDAREALSEHLGVRGVELSSDAEEREDQIDRLARGLS